LTKQIFCWQFYKKNNADNNDIVSMLFILTLKRTFKQTYLHEGTPSTTEHSLFSSHGPTALL